MRVIQLRTSSYRPFDQISSLVDKLMCSTKKKPNLVCLSTSSSSSSSSRVKIAHLPDLVATNRARAFELPEVMQEDFMDEGFVFERDGDVYAFRNRCAHVTLPLDLDDEDFFSDPEDGDYIVCKSHGARYQPKTGLCVDGPCKGKFLRKLDVCVSDDNVYLKLN